MTIFQRCIFTVFVSVCVQAIGNHEFDNGVDGLVKPFLQNVSFSVLSANIKADKTMAPRISGYYLPYKIFTVNSEKVGVIGYTSVETPALSLPGRTYITFTSHQIQ